ncbi:MAG TPA: amidohydrolase family protein [bacterium]|nr:amidohydrolase family protein [bacterium]HOL49175.1 amidohydrolase family protein [bacterium]HPO51980.1 amidohydrolase family protein [bacterium]HXK44315.1 amidohydrolase family protein [bacterium]
MDINLKGKIIDIHSHAGVSIKAYMGQEYPYAATIEGLAFRQERYGVDVNVVFPLSADLFFDLHYLKKGICKNAKKTLSSVPYEIENALLLKEVYAFCPEYEGRFIPFISVDPGRMVKKQVKNILDLEKKYRIYGIKIVPVVCQSSILRLLDEGKAFLEIARERNWPFLIHTTTHKEENFSHARLVFRVIEKNPDIRFCLAHCIGFDRNYLNLAHSLEHVWVDTSALTIQVQLARENHPIAAAREDRFDADYNDHKKVLRTLIEAFPETIIWGTDTPAYSYIARRKQGTGKNSYVETWLKATYKDEIDALRSLPEKSMMQIANRNSINFLSGSHEN